MIIRMKNNLIISYCSSCLCVTSVRMGKKKNRNALSPNAEGARSFNADRWSGKRCKLPSGSGRSPAAKRHSVHFGTNIQNALSGKALNCQQIVPSHFRVRLSHQRKISFSLCVSHLAIKRTNFPPLLICSKVIPLPLEIVPLKSS